MRNILEHKGCCVGKTNVFTTDGGPPLNPKSISEKFKSFFSRQPPDHTIAASRPHDRPRSDDREKGVTWLGPGAQQDPRPGIREVDGVVLEFSATGKKVKK